MTDVSSEWPSAGIENLGACPVCRSTDRSIIHRDLRDLIFNCAPGSWNLWNCEECGNAYLDPRPTADTIVLAYGNYFTHCDPVPTATPISRLARVRRALANGYRNWRFGAELVPASSLGIPIILALSSLRNRVDLTMRHLPRLPVGQPRRLLDVGCGNGQFLEDARRCGWIADGCDFDPRAASIARERGFDVRDGGIETWAEAAGMFDAITLSHVIEHVHDPMATLGQAWHLLRDGGTIYIDTPNIKAAGHRRYGRAWRGLEPPRHLVLFTWSSMTGALRAAGFTAIRRISRPGVYGGIAAQSAAIRDGKNPAYARGARSWAGRLAMRVHAIVPREQSEFVTLVAAKSRQ